MIRVIDICANATELHTIELFAIVNIVNINNSSTFTNDDTEFLIIFVLVPAPYQTFLDLLTPDKDLVYFLFAAYWSP